MVLEPEHLSLRWFFKLSLHLRYPTIPGTWPSSDRGRRTSPARAPRPPWRSSGPSPSSSPSRPFSTPPLWATGRTCWDRERPASWSGLMEIPGWIHHLSTPTRSVFFFGFFYIKISIKVRDNESNLQCVCSGPLLPGNRLILINEW